MKYLLGMIAVVFFFCFNGIADPGSDLPLKEPDKKIVLDDESPTTAYELCGQMDEKYFEACLKIVKSSTRRFPHVLIQYASELDNQENILAVLRASVDRDFPPQALKACEKWVSDEKIKQLVKCIELIGDIKPLTKRVQTDDLSLNRRNYKSWDSMIDSVQAGVKKTCRGWPNFKIYPNRQNPEDKTKCWNTNHSHTYTDYTLGSRPARTRRGTEYTAFTIVPVTRTRHYKLYHCHVTFYCWKTVKDYGQVN